MKMASTMMRVDFLWSKLYSSALCGIQSKPMNAQGAIATILNTPLHQLTPSGKPGAKLLQSAMPITKTVSRQIQPTSVSAMAVCNHAACLIPLILSSPIAMMNTEASTTYNHDLQQNPINVMNNGGVEKNIRNNYTVNANLKIHDFHPGLAVSLNVARRYTGQDYSEENKTLGAHGLADNSGVHQQYAVNNPNSFIRKQANSIQDKYEALITDNKEFASGHSLSALLGTTYESYRTSSMTTTVKNLTYENLFSLNYYDNTDPNNTDVEDYICTWAMNTYLARVNYSYKDRYLFESNERDDCS